MNIQPINNATPNFNGKLITKGAYTKNLKQLIIENQTLNSIVKNSDYDVVAKMSSKKASTRDLSHIPGEELFQLSIYTYKSTFFNKLKSKLGLLSKVSEQKITQSYHKEKSMLGILEDRLSTDGNILNNLKKKLNV